MAGGLGRLLAAASAAPLGVALAAALAVALAAVPAGLAGDGAPPPHDGVWRTWALHGGLHAAAPPAHAQLEGPGAMSIVGGHGPAALAAPQGVAVNSTGHVFVAAAQRGRVEVFSPGGEHLYGIGQKGDGPGQLDGPEGVAVNSTGHVLVTDVGASRLQAFGGGGAYLDTLAAGGAGRGQFRFPGQVAFDQAGRSYVADSGNGRVLAFNPDGTYLARLGSPGTGAGQLYFPVGVAVGLDGRIYVSDLAMDKIEVFASNRRHASTVQFPAGAAGHADGPYGLAVDPSDGRLYAASLAGGHVVSYSADGEYLSTIGGGEIGAPTGLAVGPDGRLYVSDRAGDRVAVFERNGTHAAYIGAEAHPVLGYPSGAAAAVDGAGNGSARLAVADMQNGRVLVYEANATGEYERVLAIGAGTTAGSNATAPVGGNATAGNATAPVGGNATAPVGGNATAAIAAQLDSPSGVAFGAGGHVYVADRGAARLYVFDAGGMRVQSVAEADGPLVSPTDVAFDARTGRVAVADGDTVVVIPGNGGEPFRVGSRGSAPGEFRSPGGVAFDLFGRILVADTFNGRVQVLAPNGSHLFDIVGAAAPSPERLAAPSGVASGPHGKIFVADWLGSSVHVFDHAGRPVSASGRLGSAAGEFDAPLDVDVDAAGRVIVADSGNGRVQVLGQADGIAPRPLSVSPYPVLPEPRVYGEGDALVVGVRFTEPVRIDAPRGGALPALLLGIGTVAGINATGSGSGINATGSGSGINASATGSGINASATGSGINATGAPRAPVIAAYRSGNNSDVLVFEYRVGAGDREPVVDYASARPLVLGQSLITGHDGNLANLTMPAAPGANGSLSDWRLSAFTNRAPAIAAVPPLRTVEGYEVLAALGAVDPDGDAVTFALAGDPPAGLEVGPGGALAWTPAPGQSGIYTVVVNATDEHGLSSAARVQIEVVGADSAAPAVLSVRAGAVGPAVAAGQAVPVLVEFSGPVNVTTGGGAPYIEMRAGSDGAYAQYHSGGTRAGAWGTGGSPAGGAGGIAGGIAGPAVLEFRYKVRDGDVAARLSYAGAGALVLNGSSIASADRYGVPMRGALPPPGAAGLVQAGGGGPVSVQTSRPVLDIGVLDEAGPGGDVSAAAYAAAAGFNSRQAALGPGAFLLRVLPYDAGASAGSAAAALGDAHAGGAGPSVYVGPSTDRGLHAAMPYAAENSLLLVSAGSTAPSLAARSDSVFRMLPSDRHLAKVLSDLAIESAATAPSGGGGADSIMMVLDEAQYGAATAPPLPVPPPAGSFVHGIDAMVSEHLEYDAYPVVALSGPASGWADEAASLAAWAGRAPAPRAVVFLGSGESFAAFVAHAGRHDPLLSAAWVASDGVAGSDAVSSDGGVSALASKLRLRAVSYAAPSGAAAAEIDRRLSAAGAAGAAHPAARYAAYDAVLVVAMAAALAAGEGRGAIGAMLLEAGADPRHEDDLGLSTRRFVERLERGGLFDPPEGAGVLWPYDDRWPDGTRGR